MIFAWSFFNSGKKIPIAVNTNKKYPPKAPVSFIFNPLKGPLTLVLEGRNLYNRKAGIKGSSITAASTYKNVLVVPITIVYINLLQAFTNCNFDK